MMELEKELLILVVEKKKKPKYLFLVRFLLKLICICLVVYLLLSYVLCLYRMTGNHMFPSIRDGDFCILYRLDDYHSNDVILYEDANQSVHMGRIIAVADQTVDFPEEGGYLVNGYQPTEEITYPTYADDIKNVSYPLTLSDGECFVMNDFRSDTKDSRQFGAIKTSQIKGKLIFMLRRRGF